MLKKLFTKAPLIAVLGAVIVFTLVASAGIGLEWPLLLATATSIFAVAEGWCLWILWRNEKRSERHMRQIRFIADRFQSMVRSLPGGYCLFTPQGLLREESGLAPRLGVNKITHMDDLIEAVAEGPELVEAFRHLQLSGEGFELEVHASKDERLRYFVGRRFRIGREGPHVDLLWSPDVLSLEVNDRGANEPIVPVEDEVAALMQERAVEPVLEVKVDREEAFSLPDYKSYETLPFPVWGRDEDLNLIFCNQAYARVVEATKEEVLDQQTALFSITPKDDSRLLAEDAWHKQEAQKRRYHVVVEGKRRLLEIVEIPLPARKCGPLALLGYAIDVTAEEEKDSELQRHLAAHHEVLEQLGTAISVFGPDQRLEFYNQAYQRLWGAPDVFLDSKPSFSEIMEDLRARNRIPEQADFQKYKKEKAALFTSLLEPAEDVMFLPDERSLRTITAPHPLGGLIFVYENVTDQIELETSYNTLVEVQTETINNLSEGVALFGLDGRLRLFNQALVRLFGYDETFLESRPHVKEMLEIARELLDVDGAWAERKEKMVSYALDRKPRQGRVKRNDDKVVSFLTVPLPDGSVLNSFSDITDSVRVEQALRASNAALATADRLKSDFVANVSYQLRTPLNTITGFAEILVEQYFGSLNDRQLEYTTTIRNESEKLSRLINDVLDLATIEAGRMVLDRSSVEVATLLNDAKEMTSDWARQQSLDILIDCPSDIGSFEVDENRMKQVLFNLISNAIKYTPAGGKIGLAAWQQEHWIVLSVLDTGVGIPTEDQERIFGKFEKANGHLRQSGTGLGLSLVKSFVELHGGRVQIFSDKKDGTRISCFVPRKQSKELQNDAA
ncbi:MAG: PAS-domain containing protein [Bdellovibrionales bacterium]